MLDLGEQMGDRSFGIMHGSEEICIYVGEEGEIS